MKKKVLLIYFGNAVLGLFLVCAGVGPPSAFAGDYRLSDTGQTRCYDSRKEIACPEPGERFYGQDGSYEGPQPAFRSNGDGTVSDLNSGLMWQQGDAQNSSRRIWRKAVAYCESLTLGGYSDWRLPSRDELVSIVNAGRYDPAIDTAYFSSCMAYYYWSGTTHASYTGHAWGVHFDVGSTYWDNKSNGSYVRCVRGGP